MRKSVVFIVLLSTLLISGCANEALRNADKFSPYKKYAVLPFDCPDKDVSLRLAKSLREWLVTFDYEIIEQEELDALLQKSGLTVEEIHKNYIAAVNNLKGIDALIIGYVNLDKRNVEDQAGISNGAGGAKNFIAGCNAFVVDLKSGEILARGNYEAPSSAEMYGSYKIDELGKKLALKLSPH